jgi:hypothetical protein
VVQAAAYPEVGRQNDKREFARDHSHGGKPRRFHRALHLAEVRAYKSGMVELCYELRGECGGSRQSFVGEALKQPTARGA